MKDTRWPDGETPGRCPECGQILELDLASLRAGEGPRWRCEACGWAPEPE